MTTFPQWALAAGLALGLTACTGKADDTGAAGDTDPETDTDTDVSYTIEGTAITFGPDRLPAPEGTCVRLFNPDDGLDGSTPEALAEGTVGAGGAYRLTGITRWAGSPPLVVIDDCDTDPPRVFPTGTPVPPELVEPVTDGGTVTGVVSVALGVETFDAIAASLAAAGDTTDLASAGLMMGFLWGDDEAGIEGAQVVCETCTVYYGDGDATDGAFTTAGTRNTAATRSGFYAIPGAPIETYSAVAEGYSFVSTPMGAIPGGALLMIFRGEAE